MKSAHVPRYRGQSALIAEIRERGGPGRTPRDGRNRLGRPRKP
jgi:hypothetical protein